MSVPDDWVRVSHVPGPPGQESRWRFGVAGMAALCAGVVAWHLVTGTPDERPWAALVGVLLGSVFVGCLVHETWLDTDGGRLVHHRVRVGRWQVPWAEAEVVRLRHNFKGMVVLQVRRSGGLMSIYVPVAGDDDRGPRGQPPEVLRMLARGVRSASRRHHGVADALDAQADHLERGGGVLDSPVLLRHSGFRIY